MVTTVEGIARNVEWQTVPTEERVTRNPIITALLTSNQETQHEPHLQFRVEEVDETGSPTGYTSVVATASSPDELPDFVADGDEVEVTGTVDDGLLDAHELTNLTTGTTVTLQRRGGLLARLGRLLLWLVAAVLLSLFWAGLLSLLGIGTSVVATLTLTMVTVVLLAAVARLTGSTRVVWGAFLLGLLGLLLQVVTVFV